MSLSTVEAITSDEFALDISEELAHPANADLLPPEIEAFFATPLSEIQAVENEQKAESYEILHALLEDPVSYTVERMEEMFEQRIAGVPIDNFEDWLDELKRIYTYLESLFNENLEHPSAESITNLFEVPEEHITSFISEEKNFDVLFSINNKERNAALKKLRELVEARTSECMRDCMNAAMRNDISVDELKHFFDAYPDIFTGEHMVASRNILGRESSSKQKFDHTLILTKGVETILEELFDGRVRPAKLVEETEVIAEDMLELTKAAKMEKERRALLDLCRKIHDTLPPKIQSNFYAETQTSFDEETVAKLFFSGEDSDEIEMNLALFYQQYKRSEIRKYAQEELQNEKNKRKNIDTKRIELLEKTVALFNEEAIEKTFDVLSSTIEDDVDVPVSEDEVSAVLAEKEVRDPIKAPSVQSIWKSIERKRVSKVKAVLGMQKRILELFKDVKLPSEIMDPTNEEEYFPNTFLDLVSQVLQDRLTEGENSPVRVERAIAQALPDLIRDEDLSGMYKDEVVEALAHQVNLVRDPDQEEDED